LTTYNGQKHLIRDVIEARCAKNPAFGRPSKVTTVDRYQGQQNDCTYYLNVGFFLRTFFCLPVILLSLVRSASVGHFRDVRRLVVAMSRARLGLYIFCRRRLFENCYELTPTFSKLLERPDKLVLVQEERYGITERKLPSDTKGLRTLEVHGVLHMAEIVTVKPQ
jgi:intron-binding protein aquarius